MKPERRGRAQSCERSCGEPELGEHQPAPGGRECRPARRLAGRAGTRAGSRPIAPAPPRSAWCVSVVICPGRRHVTFRPHAQVHNGPGAPRSSGTRFCRAGWRAGAARRAARPRGGAAARAGARGASGPSPLQGRGSLGSRMDSHLSPSLPLLALPGLLLDERMWLQQAVALARAPPARLVCHDAAADDRRTRRGALARAPAGRFALAGLSIGGYVAFEIVRRAPERVTALALLAPARGPTRPSRPRCAAAGSPPRRATSRAWCAASSRGSLPSGPSRRRLADRAPDRDGARHAAGGLRAPTGSDHRPHRQPATLAGIACPTLVLCRREDAVLPLELREETHSHAQARA